MNHHDIDLIDVGRKVGAQEEREAIVRWLRDTRSVMVVMEKWHERQEDGTLTDRTRENIGVALIAMRDAASIIEAGGWKQ